MTNKSWALAAFLMLSPLAVADNIVLNQIGPNGSYTNPNNQIGPEDYASQFVYAAPSQLGIEASTGLTITQATNISQVNVAMFACIGGCQGSVFTNPEQNFTDVTSWNVEIYSISAIKNSIPEASSNSLTGDVASVNVAQQNVSFIYDFSGVVVAEAGVFHTALVQIPVNINLAAGSYYIAVVPSLVQADYGQLGVLTTTYGNPNNVGCQTANISEFSPAIGCDTSPLAYEVFSSTPEPSSIAFVFLAALVLGFGLAAERDKYVKPLALMAVVLGCLSTDANADIITNQNEWQAISSNYGANPLTTINLTTATYVNVLIPQKEGSDALTLSLNAPFEVTFDDSNNLSGYDPFPTVANGSVASPLLRRNILIITFGEPIYAFSGILNAPGIYVGIFVDEYEGNMVSGFDGFTSDTPFTTISFEDFGPIPDDGCPCDDAQGFSISDIQVQTAPVVSSPEPASITTALFGFGLLLVAKRLRHRPS